ncbi:MAG: tetratricopeptide repeat protein [Candidatus Tectomicrobia bacterium]|nr:tetratricopeptide repeat protein [Candidatus Tectomicrobia bacterium]
MTTSQWDAVWERARASKHTVMVGPADIPPAPDDLLVLWVHCNAPWTTGGPLDEVRHRVNKLLGDDHLDMAQAPESQVVGLRSRLFDDRPVRAIDARFVEACNRLASWTGGHVVLGFEGIDAADEATVATLTQILEHPGWLRLPMIFTMPHRPQGPVAELVEVIQRADSSHTMIETAAKMPTDNASVPFDWMTLPPDVLRVLRAGSVLGSVFEAELIARLLDEPVGTVLEQLQRAADAGATLADRGEGRFCLPSEAVQALQDHMLPSLQEHWHAQLGDLLSERLPQRREAVARQAEVPGDGLNAGLMDQEPAHIEDAPTVAPSDYAEMFEPVWPPADLETESSVQDDLEEPIRGAPAQALIPDPRERDKRQEPQPRADQVRAAAHLQAAGQADAAVEQYLAAVHEVAAQGDPRRAYAIAQQALTLLDGLPPSEPRQLQRAQLLLELGRVQWQSAVLGSPFTLHDALASLEAASEALPQASPPVVAGQLATVTAGVCYDLGDLTSLQRALNELTVVSRRLLDAGESMLAACLLNDQAAVYVRLGDPVRATHLLSESRGLFESMLRVSPDEPLVVEELAATEHLLARLALHTPIRPGREDEAYGISLDHALAAESAYECLSLRWEVARVWETIGRLELGRGRPDAARGRLMGALQIQKQTGDVTGLARTAAALADLCIEAGQLGEAATLLADSVALNVDKGSPIGLAFNRRAFDALRKAAAHAHDQSGEALPRLLGEVEHRLVEAEAVLGQLVLPGEVPARH